MTVRTAQDEGMSATLALLYVALIAGVICFQIALILGAPWGKLTQGGQHEGSLPRSGRIAAAASIVLLAVMGAGILSNAGYWPNWPRWVGWGSVAVGVVSCIANWMTPSASERRLWGPITTVMLALALGVMLITTA
ncbi:MAG: hypothetical protein AAFQ64_00450 [Pseudomonadota bacterium]